MTASFGRTREFFGTGGVILSGRTRSLSKAMAGLGLALAVAVVPAELGHDRADAHSAPSPTAAAGQAPSGLDWRGALSSAGGYLEYHAEWLANRLHVHRFGSFEVPQYVASEIVRAARDTGFPADTLMAIAEKESVFDLNARPPKGSALGLMQFIEQKWFEVVLDYGPEFGLAEEAGRIVATVRDGKTHYDVSDPQERSRILEMRRDPYLSSALAAKNLIAAKERIEARLDKAMSNDDLYLPHFLGTNGAGSLLVKSEEKPDASARKAFPQAAKFNPGLFRSASGKTLTVRQLHEKARDVIAVRSGKYRDAQKEVEALDMPEVRVATFSMPLGGLIDSAINMSMLRR